MMNIHHLELFYYVARFGGISKAARQMPYGIQQPAISGQVLLLEQHLGTKLFDRNPFRLTQEGEQLYEFIRPFFDNLNGVAERLKTETTPLLRVGSSELVLRDHLPAVIGRLRAKEPRLRLTLRSGLQPELEGWLQDGEIDVAFAPLERKPPAGVKCRRLLRVPLVLLVHRSSSVKSARELLSRDPIDEPLISLPPGEGVSRVFQRGLRRLKAEWPVAIEVSSLEPIREYVAAGMGAGVSVDLTALTKHRDVRVLPLENFEPLEIAALWRGKPAPLVDALIVEAARYVAAKFPGS